MLCARCAQGLYRNKLKLDSTLTPRVVPHPLSFPGGGWGTVTWSTQNHLEERLLDQAQARAAYTPLFWGHSRSIPQGMILDLQPLVKSLFCPIRPSPNGFFDSEASTP